jgi:hypothetical protein
MAEGDKCRLNAMAQILSWRSNLKATLFFDIMT